MNKVDNLLQNPFRLQSLETKLEIKRLGCHQPRGIIIKQTTTNRTFQSQWFARKGWLTASESKKSLFAFHACCFHQVMDHGQGME